MPNFSQNIISSGYSLEYISFLNYLNTNNIPLTDKIILDYFQYSPNAKIIKEFNREYFLVIYNDNWIKHGEEKVRYPEGDPTTERYPEGNSEGGSEGGSEGISERVPELPPYKPPPYNDDPDYSEGLFQLINWNLGQLHGKFKQFDPEGYKEFDKEYHMGLKHNIWREYTKNFRGELILTSEIGYSYGKEYGDYKRWYITGNLQLQTRFGDEGIEGPYQTWYSSGKPESLTYYRKGKLYGDSLSWTEDGKIINHREYIDDKEIHKLKRNLKDLWRHIK